MPVSHVTLEWSAPGTTDSIETGKCPDEDASCHSGFCAGTGLPVVLAQNTKALVTVRRRYASHASSCWSRVETIDSAAHLLQSHAFCTNRPTVILAVGIIANHLWAGGYRGILIPDTARRAPVVQC